ncbi:helix-turn-helix domain-containing protein [Actinosynnema mirum]|uniref:helix-turn-helix domain-containing protein n=1 Tax=Actinosynnema mirum TaxID=40567 RepID=UPI0002E62B8A|nr:helix-turn-helix domain-containing protein [Actinosynnema mirum]AXX30732.1 Transcriptional regulator, AraC family [Actinosynnema pretiosum subsp. pretiosum]
MLGRELAQPQAGGAEQPGRRAARAARARLAADPARPWTTASPASALAVSRATLSRRFPAAIGQSPAAYLAQWRMDLATARLRRTLDPVESIAARVGHGSGTGRRPRSPGPSPGRGG